MRWISGGKIVERKVLMVNYYSATFTTLHTGTTMRFNEATTIRSPHSHGRENEGGYMAD